MKLFRTEVPLLRLRSILLAFSLLVVSGGTVAADPALVLARGLAGDETLEFTLEEMRALPLVTIVTENEFTDGTVEYRGPLVRDLLEHLALGDAKMIRFTAANDYYVDIPSGDFRKYNVILAMEADGAKLSRRDKGPLWLMYPLSDHQELIGDPVYNTRLIWQVVKIESL